MMLKKLTASLALTVGIANPSIADEVIKLPTELVCASEAGMSEVLDKYGEIPFATMTAFREIPGAGFTNNPMVVFVNPKTKTFTIIEQITKDIYCVVSLGDNISPYVEEK
jgi:hypothetical protein